MPVTHFPDPSDADSSGLLAIGGDLHPASLLKAYRSGIFPWPIEIPPELEEDFPPEDAPEGFILAWFSPDPRAILRFDQLHVPRSLERARRRCPYRFTVDRAFDQVIDACSTVPRPGQGGTWITRGMKDAYLTFHQLGHAHSVEAWEGEKLVGGIYGVEVDGTFAGESMFHRAPNASKLALLHLVEVLERGGLRWMDIQTMTPHMKALGASEISRDDFLKELSRTRALGLRPFEDPARPVSEPPSGREDSSA